MRVVVTGAAGSIGSELCRQLSTRDIESLVLLDTDESRLYDLWMEIDKPFAHVRICDVRNPVTVERLFRMEKPNLVIHCAAYKHVPLMEAAPVDAVNTNVIGTANVLDALELYGDDPTLIFVSTDKAVEPICVMGMTKAIAERVVLNASSRIRAMVVRFGNVLGSRGSVIPTWEAQLEAGKPLTVTHPDVERYFMSIPDAVKLILDAYEVGQSGDTLVLDMGEPHRIYDLAYGMSDDIVITGLRPGEKLKEVLHSSTETLQEVSGGIRRVVPCEP